MQCNTMQRITTTVQPLAFCSKANVSLSLQLSVFFSVVVMQRLEMDTPS
jgi:hypothetical protein